MRIKQLELILKERLGDAYGGPSVSFQDGKFVIYEWSDAPVTENILGTGNNLEEAIVSAGWIK